MNARDALAHFLDGKGSDRLLCNGFRYDPSPVVRATPGVETRRCEQDGMTVVETIAPGGNLISRFCGAHPVSYPVKNADDMRILRNVEQSTTLSINPVLTLDYDDVLSRISVAPSPVQRLLQYDMGLENFYALYLDEPRLMRDLLDAMMVNYERECRLISELPVRSVRLVENTSTTMISPSIYEELSLSQLARACEIFHVRDKLVFAHMCGHLRDLLPIFPRLGIDGIHSVTPPPVGDVTFEAVYAAMGDAFRVEGRLGTVCWLGKSVDEIRHYLQTLISTDRIKRSPFLLEVHSDGIEDIPEEQWRNVRKVLDEWSPS